MLVKSSAKVIFFLYMSRNSYENSMNSKAYLLFKPCYFIKTYDILLFVVKSHIMISRGTVFIFEGEP